MKCSIGTDERWPTLTIDSVNGKNEDHDVPPKLLNALQAADIAYTKAMQDIVRHLVNTDQEVSSSAKAILQWPLVPGIKIPQAKKRTLKEPPV